MNHILAFFLECRMILLPMICYQIKPLLEQKEGTEKEKRERQDEMELCVKIISDIMIALYNRNIGSTHNDISEIMLSILRTIIQCVVHLDNNPLMVRCMLFLII